MLPMLLTLRWGASMQARERTWKKVHYVLLIQLTALLVGRWLDDCLSVAFPGAEELLFMISYWRCLPPLPLYLCPLLIDDWSTFSAGDIGWFEDVGSTAPSAIGQRLGNWLSRRFHLSYSGIASDETNGKGASTHSTHWDQGKTSFSKLQKEAKEVLLLAIPLIRCH